MPQVRITRSVAGAVTAIVMLASACVSSEEGESKLAQHDDSEAAPRSLTERLEMIDRELGEGLEGRDVDAVQEYLTTFGYLPNEELSRLYPTWKPLVEETPTRGAFDRVTTSALMAFQQHAGVEPTGFVDEPTLQALTAPRCGVPEGTGDVRNRQKWATNTKWNKSSFTWRVMNTDDGIPLANVRSAVSDAFARWVAATSITATEITSGTPDIRITFEPIDGTALVVGVCEYPTGGGDGIVDMKLDTAELWSYTLPPAAGAHDIMTIVLHELGHGLGVNHTSILVNDPVMKAVTQAGIANRTLRRDDAVAVSALYDSWVTAPGFMRELAIGQGPFPAVDVWGIGTDVQNGGFGIYKFLNGGWTKTTDGAAVRVAVAPDGTPWVINNANQIYRRNSTSPTSGSWIQQIGLAREIAIGADGSVWVIGMDAANGGYGVWKFVGTGWVKTNDAGAGVRIAVGPTGNPWIVNNVGQVFRRSTNATGSGSWILKGGSEAAMAIAVNRSEDAWIVRNTLGFAIWDEQPAIPNSTPARAKWVDIPGSGIGFAAGELAGEWAIYSDYGLRRKAK
jgi:peptidoglycan hydrolase-like protein with peptidoglycan-binding domain